jgi:peptidoglycan/xylan/chitin deacetylase (PgdA/CDA1 family)
MYHYINSSKNERKNFNHISLKKFNHHIKRFKSNMSSEENDIFKKKTTTFSFDDGLKEHLHAAETLKKNNKIGIFFIPTMPIKNKKFLDVHKAHIILSQIGAKKANGLINNLYPKLEKKFFNHKEQYSIDKKKENNQEIYFKSVVNYIRPKNISKSLDEILKKNCSFVSIENFYLNKKEIRHIKNLGMIIGSHAHSHNVLSSLNYKHQLIEIEKSGNFLSKIIGQDVSYFSYPYGNSISYNKDTIKALKKNKIKYAFRSNLLKHNKNKLEFPRLDCSLI